jgi:hypothetical protein
MVFNSKSLTVPGKPILANQGPLAFFAVSLWLLSSCNIINPAEPVPGYVKVEKFTITPVPSLGTDSNKITDVFAYTDTKFQGSYELPAQFPVIETGTREMIFFAGIIVNGISNTRADYPFYDSYKQTVNLEPGKIITINPVIKYSENVVASWLESFQGAGVSLLKFSGTDIEITKLPPADVNNYEGISGVVYLKDAQTHFKISTDTSYNLPKANSAVFLEMNYKCNNTFAIGMIAVTGTATYEIPVISINKKENWNKIYIELGSIVKAYVDANYFKIYFEAYKEDGVANAEFYFDNFKLLHN